jgi:2-polyprenyl-3-methyl-5-hydroxy-6-metoxy-1,4-benzoquinol methylase
VRDWKTFWELYPRRAHDNDLLKQVGRTVNGKPISSLQFSTMLDDIFNLLELDRNDVVLDLCCGNGVITKEVAKKCKHVVGIDFSDYLIEQANKSNKLANVEYLNLDVRELGRISHDYLNFFDKVNFYEALAFLNLGDLIDILTNLKLMTKEKRIILIGSVLDRDRKWKFFNTFNRKLTYVTKILVLRQKVGLGRWWSKREIVGVCDQLDLHYEFHEQKKILHTSHYRFDVRIF